MTHRAVGITPLEHSSGIFVKLADGVTPFITATTSLPSPLNVLTILLSWSMPYLAGGTSCVLSAPSCAVPPVGCSGKCLSYHACVLLFLFCASSASPIYRTMPSSSATSRTFRTPMMPRSDN